jgi:hypothetical protein
MWFESPLRQCVRIRRILFTAKLCFHVQQYQPETGCPNGGFVVFLNFIIKLKYTTITALTKFLIHPSRFKAQFGATSITHCRRIAK